MIDPTFHAGTASPDPACEGVAAVLRAQLPDHLAAGLTVESVEVTPRGDGARAVIVLDVAPGVVAAMREAVRP